MSILDCDWLSTLVRVIISETVDSIDSNEIWFIIDDSSSVIEEWVFESLEESNRIIGYYVLWSGC